MVENLIFLITGPMAAGKTTVAKALAQRFQRAVPSLEEIEAREAGRSERGYDRWPLQQFYEGFVATTPRIGFWLNTTSQSPEETVDDILRLVR